MLKHDRRASVTIEFTDPAAALQWFEQAQRADLLPAQVALVVKDGLDRMKGGEGNVPGVNELLVSDRPTGRLGWSSRISDRVAVMS